MLRLDRYQWKQAVEGIARGDIGPFEWRNRSEGADSFREYLDGTKVVLRMRVIECLTEREGHACDREFEGEAWVIAATEGIYIPTDEEYEEWDEFELVTNEPQAARRIAEKEGR